MNTTQVHKILQIRHLTDQAYVLRLEKKGFQFIPGQCVNIGLIDGAVNREYSTYSGINDDYLEFLIKEVQDGLVSPELKKLNPGDQVQLDGAYGLFTLKEPENKKLKYTFIASGTGISPFHTYVKSYPELDYQILHGIRFANEQYDKQDYKNGQYISCVSRDKQGGDFHGRVTDFLKKNKPDHDRIYYLCGNADMINDVYDILREAGVGGSNIYTEVFF
jgi:ferredoxin-NADP reductase